MVLTSLIKNQMIQSKFLNAKYKRTIFFFKIKKLELTNWHVSVLITKRASPHSVCLYKIAMQLCKTYNLLLPEKEWVHLNWQQTFTLRQTTFKIIRNNNYKVGMNCQSNKFHVLTDKIPLLWLNKSLASFKNECKKLLFNR